MQVNWLPLADGHNLARTSWRHGIPSRDGVADAVHYNHGLTLM
jgi:hypothetical protein